MKTQNKTRTTLYIDSELYKKIKYIAVTRDVRFSTCITKALEEYVEKNKKYLP